jgi:hypothetical protein
MNVTLDEAYSAHAFDVPYPNVSRQCCDWCLGSPSSWDWAIEAKLLRLFRDNGKLKDNMLMHILSPYPAHRSALTDCAKLATSGLAGRKAILIFGYDYDAWLMDPASKHSRRKLPSASSSVTGMKRPTTA